MDKNLVAKASTLIEGSKHRVWAALVTPAAIKQYMFGTDVVSEWRKGSRITWKGNMAGKPYEDKGVILQIEPEQTLQYSHFSSLSGEPDKPENYHTVTVNLSGSGHKTEVTLTQDNNADEKARKESAQNWGAMLEGLKKYVEQAGNMN